jgi:O-antigen chain-terminating methyltransferase
MDKEAFYRAFEDRHRGGRELIAQRLNQYRPFVEPFLEGAGEVAPEALDLGCGRGEWLELLGNLGFKATGVDLDGGMLEACLERNLNAVLGDAGEFLRERADESFHIVSGFHFAEHIPFEHLLEIVGEALRVLKPGGLLILETPNPENLTVGTSSFYLDPSHSRPIPPELLKFIVDYAGFDRATILRLQESELIDDLENLSLRDVLVGVSPDYSVVSQKPGPAEFIRQFDEQFSKDHGLSLRKAIDSYEGSRDSELEKLHMAVEEKSTALDLLAKGLNTLCDERRNVEDSLGDFAARLSELREEVVAAGAMRKSLLEQLRSANTEISELRLSVARLENSQDALQKRLGLSAERERALESELESLRAQLAGSQSALRSLEHQNIARTNQLSDQLTAVYDSKSWKITAPLRRCLDYWNGLRGRPTGRTPNAGFPTKSNRRQNAPGAAPRDAAHRARDTAPIETDGASEEQIDRFLERIYREVERRDRQ